MDTPGDLRCDGPPGGERSLPRGKRPGCQRSCNMASIRSGDRMHEVDMHQCRCFPEEWSGSTNHTLRLVCHLEVVISLRRPAACASLRRCVQAPGLDAHELRCTVPLRPLPGCLGRLCPAGSAYDPRCDRPMEGDHQPAGAAICSVRLALVLLPRLSHLGSTSFPRAAMHASQRPNIGLN